MVFNNFIRFIFFVLLFLGLSLNIAQANTYTSEIFSSLESCDSQKEKNNSLYPNFYRSNCVEGKKGNFYYNICDTNYCVATKNTDQFTEKKDPGVYQYDGSKSSNVEHSTDYKLDDKTSQYLKKLAANLEKRFQKMSGPDLDQWNTNFIQVLDQLAEKSSKNDKNLALIQGIKDEVSIILEKQKREHDLCKNQYGEGWKEASFFFESDNMVSWIEGNKKQTLACEFKKPVKKQEAISKKSSNNNNSGTIDVYNPPVITDEPVESDVIDITKPIQGLYRATSKKYTSEQTYRYTKIDLCAKEFGLDWQESTKTNADPYIMLYNRYNIETSGYSQYWNGKKMVLTPKTKLLHKACVKNTLGTVIDEKYRVTQGKYRGNILRDGDVCKKEYGNEWKISRNKDAYATVFDYQSKDYPSLGAWQLFNAPGFDTCGGFHGNDSWNGSVYTTNKKNPIVIANSCSFNPSKKSDSAKYHYNFVCEKDITGDEDVTAIVQGLYKVTKNQYSYNSAYSQDYDYCKVEYGRSWKRNTESVDANIMLHKQYGLNTWLYNPAGGQFAWNGNREINQTSNNLNHVACIEDINHYYNENYKDYYTPTSAEGVHEFMKSIEKEIQTKIQIKEKHIIFNNKYAITKKKYYGNQVYSARKCPNNAEYCNNGSELSGVCPIGYQLDNFSLKYNNYEKELIGYYLAKNKDKFHGVKENSGGTIGIHLWRWGNYDERYSREFSLDRIKNESQVLNFSTHKILLVNPGLSMKQIQRYNRYEFWSDIGSSYPVGNLLPVLCVNKQAEINTGNNKNKIHLDFKGIKTITDAVYMNESDIEGGSGIFYTYGKMIALGFFEKSSKYKVIDNQFFLPIRTKIGSSRILFMKKNIKE